MFVGHIAAGLALKRVAPAVPLGYLAAAALLPDFVLGVLVLSGVERVLIPPDYDRLRYLTFDFPYSHGFAAGLAWSGAVYGAAWLRWRRHVMAAVLGMAVASHYLLDFLVHVAGMPLLGAGSPEFAVGLWKVPWAAASLEGLLVFLGLVLYMTLPLGRRSRHRGYWLAVVVVFLAAISIGGQLLGPPPPSAMALGVIFVVQAVVVVMVAFYLDPPDRRGAGPRTPESLGRRLADILTGRERRRRARRPAAARPPVAKKEEEEREEEEREEEEREEEEPDEPSGNWPPQRIEITDRLWGKGFITPGGAEYVIEFVQLLALDEKKSLLDLGAGLGGPARAMVTEHGVWVTGMESQEELVEPGTELSVMTGQQRRATVTGFDPERIKLRENAFNVVMALETFWTIADKERLFKAVEQALRLHGELLFTDFVLPGTDPPNEALRRWIDTESRRPHLWTVARMTSHLNSLAFDLRIAEDISDVYRKMVLKGWYDLVNGLTRKDLTPEFTARLIGECEYWLNRLAALDSGGLRMYRFHAIRLSKPKD